MVDVKSTEREVIREIESVYKFNETAADDCKSASIKPHHHYLLGLGFAGDVQSYFLENMCEEVLTTIRQNPQLLRRKLVEANKLDKTTKTTAIRTIEAERRIVDGDYRGYTSK